jgi:hypothetical protein
VPCRAQASKAGRWDVVGQLAKELDARRLARASTRMSTTARRRLPSPQNHVPPVSPGIKTRHPPMSATVRVANRSHRGSVVTWTRATASPSPGDAIREWTADEVRAVESCSSYARVSLSVLRLDTLGSNADHRS